MEQSARDKFYERIKAAPLAALDPEDSTHSSQKIEGSDRVLSRALIIFLGKNRGAWS